MGLIEFLSDLFGILGNIQPYQKPRRFFARGFVAFCIMVAVLELMTLNHVYNGRG